MNSKDLIEIFKKQQEKQQAVEWYGLTKNIKVNSKEQFKKYGINTTIITMFSQVPKITDISNNEIKELKNSKTLLTFQKLESILYTQGVAALKIHNKDTWIPAEVIDYIENFENELIYIKVKLTYVHSTSYIEVIEEWFKDNEGNYKFEWKLLKPATIETREAIEWLNEQMNYTPIYSSKIPYKLFFNNSLRLPDLNFVNNEYFELLNRDLEVILNDSYLSAPWIFSSDFADIKKKVQKGLFNLTERFIPLNAQITVYDNEPIRMIQSQSQAQLLIQKIEKNIAWIKRWAFMKQGNQDMGTKNMHNVEAQAINSDFEDYIESKANLREMQIKELLILSGWNVENVLIYGSTEWLLTEAKKYTVNMNGAQIANFNNEETENKNENEDNDTDGEQQRN